MSSKEIMVSGKPLSSLRVVDLKEELEKRGLSKSGSKKDLADRLKKHLLLENQRNIQSSTDEEQLPNLSTREQLAENPFLRDYFESQAELYHSQKVVKKLYEGMAHTPEEQQQPASAAPVVQQQTKEQKQPSPQPAPQPEKVEEPPAPPVEESPPPPSIPVVQQIENPVVIQAVTPTVPPVAEAAPKAAESPKKVVESPKKIIESPKKVIEAPETVKVIPAPTPPVIEEPEPVAVPEPAPPAIVEAAVVEPLKEAPKPVEDTPKLVEKASKPILECSVEPPPVTRATRSRVAAATYKTIEPEKRKEISFEPEKRKEVSPELEKRKEISAEPEKKKEASVEREKRKEISAEPEKRKETSAEPEMRKETSAEPQKRKETSAEPEKRKEASAEPEKRKETIVEPEKRKETSAEPEKRKEASAEPVKPKETIVEPEKPKETKIEPVKPKETSVEPERRKEASPEKRKESSAEPEKRTTRLQKVEEKAPEKVKESEKTKPKRGRKEVSESSEESESSSSSSSESSSEEDEDSRDEEEEEKEPKRKSPVVVQKTPAVVQSPPRRPLEEVLDYEDEESNDKKEEESTTWKRRVLNRNFQSEVVHEKPQASRTSIDEEEGKEKSSSKSDNASPKENPTVVAAAPVVASVSVASTEKIVKATASIKDEQMDVDEALDYGEEESDIKKDEEYIWSRRILRLKNRCSVVEKPEKRWNRVDRKPVVVTSSVLEAFFPDVKPLSEAEVRLEERISKEPEEPPIKKEIEFSANNDESIEDGALPNFKRKISIIPFEETVKELTPPRNPATSLLVITNLTRPFTLTQLKELLQRTGTIEDIWVDKIKSKCIAKFENQEDAEETRSALHGIKWPPSNPKSLFVDFTTEAEFDRVSKEPEDKKVSIEKPKEAKALPVREWDLGKRSRSRSPGRTRRSGSGERKRLRKSVSPHGRRSPHHDKKSRDHDIKEETQVKALDELFRKTTATPCLYWLPLTPEQHKMKRGNFKISEKEEMRRKRMVERERRLAEMEKLRPR